jgi:hypothetical protein
MFTVIWNNKALDELADVYVAVSPAERAGSRLEWTP